MMNYGALILAAVGGVAVVVAVKNTHGAVLDTITGKKSNPNNVQTFKWSNGTAGAGASYNGSFTDPNALRQSAINDANAAGIDPGYFVKQIQAESNFDPNAKSPAGAIGIAQFMPATAAGLGVNPYDPQSALLGAAKYMASLIQQFGGEAPALAAYNAGPGAVQNAQRTAARYHENWRDLLPAETQAYITKVMGN